MNLLHAGFVPEKAHMYTHSIRELGGLFFLAMKAVSSKQLDTVN